MKQMSNHSKELQDIQVAGQHTKGFSSFIRSIAVCISPLYMAFRISTRSRIDSTSIRGCMFASIANFWAADG